MTKKQIMAISFPVLLASLVAIVGFYFSFFASSQSEIITTTETVDSVTTQVKDDHALTQDRPEAKSESNLYDPEESTEFSHAIVGRVDGRELFPITQISNSAGYSQAELFQDSALNPAQVEDSMIYQNIMGSSEGGSSNSDLNLGIPAY